MPTAPRRGGGRGGRTSWQAPPLLGSLFGLRDLQPDRLVRSRALRRVRRRHRRKRVARRTLRPVDRRLGRRRLADLLAFRHAGLGELDDVAQTATTELLWRSRRRRRQGALQRRRTDRLVGAELARGRLSGAGDVGRGVGCPAERVGEDLEREATPVSRDRRGRRRLDERHGGSGAVGGVEEVLQVLRVALGHREASSARLEGAGEQASGRALRPTSERRRRGRAACPTARATFKIAHVCS